MDAFTSAWMCFTVLGLVTTAAVNYQMSEMVLKMIGYCCVVWYLNLKKPPWSSLHACTYETKISSTHSYAVACVDCFGNITN